MPVRKFRSIEEMKRPRRLEPGDPALYVTIRQLWDLGRRTSHRRFRSGVYKYRSFEEMNEESESRIVIDSGN